MHVYVVAFFDQIVVVIILFFLVVNVAVLIILKVDHVATCLVNPCKRSREDPVDFALELFLDEFSVGSFEEYHFDRFRRDSLLKILKFLFDTWIVIERGIVFLICHFVLLRFSSIRRRQ